MSIESLKSDIQECLSSHSTLREDERLLTLLVVFFGDSCGDVAQCRRWEKEHDLDSLTENLDRSKSGIHWANAAAKAIMARSLGTCDNTSIDYKPQLKELHDLRVSTLDFIEWARSDGVEFSAYELRTITRLINQIKVDHFRDNKIDDVAAKNLMGLSLWHLETGILSLGGYESLGAANLDFECVAKDELMVAAYEEAVAAFRTASFKLLRDKERGLNPLRYSVRPADILAWARHNFPDLGGLQLFPDTQTPSEIKDYRTLEMDILDAAVCQFWSDFDQSNPDPNIAPNKKQVVDWMIDEANKQGVLLTRSLAEKMETVIRHPSARRGGTRRYKNQ
jgi:hypothetical protein